MPPKLTARQQAHQRQRKLANEVDALKATGSDTLGEAIDAATNNPYNVVETSFRAAVKAYLGQSPPTRRPKTRVAAKRKGKGKGKIKKAVETSEDDDDDDDEDEDGDQATALDIEWTSEQEELLDQVRSEYPKLLTMNQKHKSLYKTVFRFMHCLPSDVIGPKTFLEFDSSLAANNQWTMHFCERLGELAPQPLFRGSPAKLALAIQWAVICRTDDRRKYRLSGCADDGFLQCLTTVIDEKQDGTETCVKLRRAALRLYRERYPEEGFAEPIWCQLLRHIEERTFPDGEPVEEAPKNNQDPYLVHTEHLTTVYVSLNRMQHLSLRIFTDNDTVHTTAELSRRFNDRPLQPEAEKAWEAHLITWQQEKASRDDQSPRPSLQQSRAKARPADDEQRPRRRRRGPSPSDSPSSSDGSLPSDSSSPSDNSSPSDSDYWRESSAKATRNATKKSAKKSAKKTDKGKPEQRASLVDRRIEEDDASDSFGQDFIPSSSPPPRSLASARSSIDRHERDNDDGALDMFGDDDDLHSQQGQDSPHSPTPFMPLLSGDSDDHGNFSPANSDLEGLYPENIAPRRRKRADSTSEPPPRPGKRQRRHDLVDSSSDSSEPSQTLQEPKKQPLTMSNKARTSSQIIPDSMEEETSTSGVKEPAGIKTSGADSINGVPITSDIWRDCQVHIRKPMPQGNQDVHVETQSLGYDDIHDAYIAHRNIKRMGRHLETGNPSVDRSGGG